MSVLPDPVPPVILGNEQRVHTAQCLSNKAPWWGVRPLKPNLKVWTWRHHLQLAWLTESSWPRSTFIASVNLGITAVPTSEWKCHFEQGLTERKYLFHVGSYYYYYVVSHKRPASHLLYSRLFCAPRLLTQALPPGKKALNGAFHPWAWEDSSLHGKRSKDPTEKGVQATGPRLALPTRWLTFSSPLGEHHVSTILLNAKESVTNWYL